MEDLKRFTGKVSGRPSIIHGAKFSRGFVVYPHQILDLLHDTQPGLPIPKDAELKGIGIQDMGRDSKIQFYFSSIIAPNECCLEMKPDHFFRTLVNLADGLLPTDSELDGIEVSKNWTVIMLRVTSSHWPPAPKEEVPLYHLRYDYGSLGRKELILTDPSKIVEENSRRIRIQ